MRPREIQIQAEKIQREVNTNNTSQDWTSKPHLNPTDQLYNKHII